MLGKVLESCHSIVVQVIHFSSVVNLGVAPFLPTTDVKPLLNLETARENLNEGESFF